MERGALHDRPHRRVGRSVLFTLVATLLTTLLLAGLPAPASRAMATDAPGASGPPGAPGAPGAPGTSSASSSSSTSSTSSEPSALSTLTAAMKPAVTPTPGCLPAHDGYLRARLRGASDLDIRWDDAQLQCDGGLRPTGGGILVTFVGHTRQGHHRLRFVFGIDAHAAAGVTRERAANVTVIFEGEQRLYSTRGDGRCTVDRLQQIPATRHAGSRGPGGPRVQRILRVQARGFCIAPATALDGHGELLLSRFDFAGLIHLGS